MTGRQIHPGKVATQARYWRLHGRPDIAERLEASLVEGGRCKRCGRTLTDPASITVGIGPDCLRRETELEAMYELLWTGEAASDDNRDQWRRQ